MHEDGTVTILRFCDKITGMGAGDYGSTTIRVYETDRRAIRIMQMAREAELGRRPSVQEIVHGLVLAAGKQEAK